MTSAFLLQFTVSFKQQSQSRDKGIPRLHIFDEDADINDDDDTIEIAEDD